MYTVMLWSMALSFETLQISGGQSLPGFPAIMHSIFSTLKLLLLVGVYLEASLGYSLVNLVNCRATFIPEVSSCVNPVFSKTLHRCLAGVWNVLILINFPTACQLIFLLFACLRMGIILLANRISESINHDL